MKNIFIDIILHNEFSISRAQTNILCVSGINTRHKTRRQWLDKFREYSQKSNIPRQYIQIKFFSGFKHYPFNGFSPLLPFFIAYHRPTNLIINRYDNLNAFLIYFLVRLISPQTKIWFYSELWLYPKNFIYRTIKPVVSRLLVHSQGHYVIGKQQKKFLIKQNVDPENIIITHDIPYAPAIPSLDLITPLIKKLAAGQQIHLLYIGRIIPYKGLLKLLKQFSRLTGQYPNKFLLTIVGGGQKHNRSQYSGSHKNYELKCRRYAKAHLPVNSYKFLGFQKNPGGFYRRADLVVMPNIIISKDIVPAEAWGRIIPEALQHQTPVLTTAAVASAHDYIKQGVNGWLVKSFNFSPLTNLILKLSEKQHK